MNKNWQYGLNWALISLLCWLPALYNVANSSEENANTNAQEQRAFEYHPPNLGTSRTSIGGGTRSLSSPVQVLAPKHVGLTSRSQPRLYWYLVAKMRNKQRFQITDINSQNPLLNVRLPSHFKGGIQELDLAKYHVSLIPGNTYRWRVVLESESSQEGDQIVSSGVIKFTAENPVLEQTNAKWRPYLAAEQGLWYDALDWVSSLVEHEHNAAYWRQQRATLLEQGGLKDVAMYERLARDE